MADQWPSVSVLMPLLNEEAGLGEVMASLNGQVYPGEWELVAVDGGSSDGTVATLLAWKEKMPRLLVLPAPPGHRNLTASLNLATEAATGEIAIRADAHTLYEPDYLHRNVECLVQTGADLVGGPMRPRGETTFGRAVAAAMGNPWVVGPAPYRRASTRRPADTVYLGAIRRHRLRELGFRGFPSGVGEDADLAYRVRSRGGAVVLDPAIRSRYRPRATPAGLWRQFYRYGKGKAEMLYANRRLPSLRPLAPMALIFGLAFSLVMTPALGWWWASPVTAATWLGYLGVVCRAKPRLWAAASLMQLSNGLGIAVGLARGPGRVRRALDT
ncbi:MAG: glycosyltransferase family 2 protein [Actinomycetia bacterium]|nr:glycosyltransferase family 2 protein [Actinomycetes bacterium]